MASFEPTSFHRNSGLSRADISTPEGSDIYQSHLADGYEPAGHAIFDHIEKHENHSATVESWARSIPSMTYNTDFSKNDIFQMAEMGKDLREKRAPLKPEFFKAYIEGRNNLINTAASAKIMEHIVKIHSKSSKTEYSQSYFNQVKNLSEHLGIKDPQDLHEKLQDHAKKMFAKTGYSKVSRDELSNYYRKVGNQAIEDLTKIDPQTGKNVRKSFKGLPRLNFKGNDDSPDVFEYEILTKDGKMILSPDGRPMLKRYKAPSWKQMFGKILEKVNQYDSPLAMALEMTNQLIKGQMVKDGHKAWNKNSISHRAFVSMQVGTTPIDLGGPKPKDKPRAGGDSIPPRKDDFKSQSLSLFKFKKGNPNKTQKPGFKSNPPPSKNNPFKKPDKDDDRSR